MLREVFWALFPVVAVFAVSQVIMLKLPKRQLKKIVRGMLLVFLGVALFLQGVHVGFLPAGDLLGKTLGSIKHNWILVPLGFLLGFAAVLAEPAVLVLSNQVEEISGGHINKKILLYALAIGVALSVALSMARVLLGISLWYFLIPGYILVIGLAFLSDPAFVGIAFDSGGAATGPMTVTFILALTVGAAKVLENRNPLLDGFGMIALVALTPILAILSLGFLYSRKERNNG
ncbi:DUF1538 domain-containing protein [Hydrogenispora ethanolica]|uniref:DUF1538 domain-containing protein n=1 Tax=Hydrogenispora ethanolica TaxID=1082276 RepID=UPI00311E1659